MGMPFDLPLNNDRPTTTPCPPRLPSFVVLPVGLVKGGSVTLHANRGDPATGPTTSTTIDPVILPLTGIPTKRRMPLILLRV